MGAEYSKNKNRHKFRVQTRSGRGQETDTTEQYLEWLFITNFKETKEAFENADEQVKQNVLTALNRETFFEAPFLVEMHLTIMTNTEKDEFSEQI